MDSIGTYNPHQPRILGQEWVPIRDEDVIFSQTVNNVERGHKFTLSSSKTLTEAKFYIHEFPPAFVACQTWTAAVYPAGRESQSGPIRSVMIPCNNGGITGSGLTLRNSTTVAQALADSSDDNYLEWAPGNGNQDDLAMFFAVNQYAPVLAGKRILGVNFVYSAELIPTATATEQTIFNSSVATDFDLNTWLYPSPFGAPPPNPVPVVSGHDFINGGINRIAIGDTNLYFAASTTMIETIPWTYDSLARFEASAVGRIQFHIRSLGSAAVGFTYSMDYAALEVFYCEETRIAVGSLMISAPAAVERFYVMGQNGITMRGFDGIAPPVVTPAGDYYLTLAQSSVGDLTQALLDQNRQPMLNGSRQLYPMPAHPGVEIRIPQPLTDGGVLTSSEIDVLPQLSLHTATGPLTEVHAYGRQAIAQVWGTVTATQEIYDAGLSAASYPQVRFYARRFGNTVTPLRLTSAAFPTSITSITPGDFDVLAELVDGWKEVTLSFTTAPSMGVGTNPQWTFSATGELAGSRWEVLGAAAPAISGVTGNMLNLATLVNQLYPATYGAPISGAPINLGWISGISPLVSATTDDQASDATLIFSQNMPTITGMTVLVTNQPVTGIGQNCGINPIYIPSQIQYNQVNWPFLTTDVVYDNFNRTAAATWGNATSGQTWLTGSPTAYSTTGTVGQVTPTTTNVYMVTSATGSSLKDVKGFYRIASSMAASGADHWGSVFVRSGGAGGTGDQLYVRVGWETDGTVKLYLSSVTANVHTTLASRVIAQTYTLGTFFNVRFSVVGNIFQAKAWINGALEPDEWMLDTAVTANFVAGTVGTRVIAGPGSPIPVVSFEDITVTDINFGAFELQRMDTVDTTWQTIMLATSPTVTGFKDFEARVNLLSSYRLRALNVLNFAGPWSSTVTATIPAPGVTGTEIAATSNVLIFTTNELQNGSANLAYSEAWEDSVDNQFEFVEAAFVQLQAMYNKDFFTAFRPHERGGERFSKTILVQAAAISPPTLGDFTSLRNMAWADVNYICVRDQEGNRWLATVLVPAGNVRRFRKLYMAEVAVVEVTTTPTPVDPS